MKLIQPKPTQVKGIFFKLYKQICKVLEKKMHYIYINL